VAAWTQLACASLLLLNAVQSPLRLVAPDDFLFLLAVALLFGSAVALLHRRPASWRAAMWLQVALLAYEVGLALRAFAHFYSYDPRTDPGGIVPYVTVATLLVTLSLALCSVTALLYLLRPRTRESYGLPPGAR